MHPGRTLNQLDWLIECRLQSITKRENDWVFAFDAETSLVTDSLWRLLEAGRICVTDHDDGQLFGRPAPVDVTADVTARIVNRAIVAVQLREGTLDLRIQFETGHVLEVIPDSSGYEAWIVRRSKQQFIAVGGGDLLLWEPP